MRTAPKSIRAAHTALGKVVYQRCFYLFLALILLIASAPLVEPTPTGRILINLVNAFLILSVAAVVGRSAWSFLVVLLLAAPYVALHWRAFDGHDPEASALALGFGLALYAVALIYLLQYVFRTEVMTTDKLYGAAAAYLMIGVLWAYLYALLEQFHPQSFAFGGTPSNLSMPEFLYFSFTVLTSTGFGDVTPIARQTRSACMVEQVTGALFVAILIARLVGVYPPKAQRNE